MSTMSQSTRQDHRTSRKPHRWFRTRHMDRLKRKIRDKLNLTADQERDFNSLVGNFYELRDSHADRWLTDNAISPFDAMESALAEASKRVQDIRQQVEDFRWTLTEEQQMVFDELVSPGNLHRRRKYGRSRHRVV